MANEVILRFNGVKVDALGTNWNVVKSVPGGVTVRQDGPIDNYSGGESRTRCRASRCASVPRVSLRKGFNPAAHAGGGEFEATYDEGDPVNGGTTLTLQGAFAAKSRLRSITKPATS